MRLGDARLLERIEELEAELSEMDACADELEIEIEGLHGDNQTLHGRVEQLEVSRLSAKDFTELTESFASLLIGTQLSTAEKSY